METPFTQNNTVPVILLKCHFVERLHEFLECVQVSLSVGKFNFERMRLYRFKAWTFFFFKIEESMVVVELVVTIKFMWHYQSTLRKLYGIMLHSIELISDKSVLNPFFFAV